MRNKINDINIIDIDFLLLKLDYIFLKTKILNLFLSKWGLGIVI